MTTNTQSYAVQSWYISGEHTGYRVMKGGDPIRGFAADWKRDGDFERAKRQAQTLCDTLNLCKHEGR